MRIRKFLLATALSLTVLALGTRWAHATAVPSSFCQPDKTLFEKLADVFSSLDIRKTVENMILTSITDGPMNLIASRNPTQMMECSWYTLIKEKEATRSAFSHETQLEEIQNGCPGIEDRRADIAAACEDFSQTYDAKISYYDIGGQKVKFGQTTTSGSLLGIANTVEGAVRTEPLPVNLAYFWNDSIKNIPFASTALAADVKYSNAPMISAVLGIWKTARNIAFGILSIVMLVTGVMIMTRKKLSPQLVVTAQYALPRIVLAVILIAFSYPIGAVAASSMAYLRDLSVGIIWGADPTVGTSIGMGAGGAAGLIALILIAALAIPGVGIAIFVFTCICLLVILVLYIAMWVRAVLIYVKLILSIVIAPISFSLGAIPGNEAMWGNWFKHTAAYIASYVGMFAFWAVGRFIIESVLGSSSNVSAGASVSAFVSFLFFPMIIIWLLIQTLKVPGKIETLIMGEPKRPGGKK